MRTTVTFGEAETCQIALGEHTVLAPNDLGRLPLGDVAAGMQSTLSAPEGYPPLRSAVVPGDLVAIALGRRVPQVGDVLLGAIQELIAAGIHPQDIAVISADTIGVEDQSRATRNAVGVQFEVHNPDDQDSIAMVGMTKAHRPLRFNRRMADADFVLPIGAARRENPAAGPDKFALLFPSFSNRETQTRLRGQNVKNASGRTQRTAESDEAGWLLGVGMSVLVVPGPGGTVAAIVAGEPAAVAHSASDAFRAIWERPTQRQGDLVIASMPGGESEQTWANLARAVAAAEKVLSPEGAIAVCCELKEKPSGAFDELADAVDFGAVARRLRRDPATNALPARVLARSLERGPVYLLSRLPTDLVESLGMTPIENEAELSRLAAGRRHCVVIEEAQRLRPRYAGNGGKS